LTNGFAFAHYKIDHFFLVKNVVGDVQIDGVPCFMTLIANGCIFATLGALFQTFPDDDAWGY